MGDARGCRGGLRRGLRRCRAAPPLPLVVLPPDGVSTLSVCARPRPAETAGRGPHRLCPLTAPAAPASQMAASAGGKSLRARCGVPLRPPVPLLRRLARQRRRAAPPAGSRHPIFLEWWRWLLRGHSAAVAPFAGLAAGSQGRGGLAPAAFGRRAAAAARPSAPAPPPGFGPGAGLFCFRCGGFGDCAACGRR